MMRAASRLPWLLIFALLGLLLPAVAVPRMAAAQGVAQEAPAPPAEGDLLWSFSESFPFFDSRVALAFNILIDESAVTRAAGLPAGSRLLYGDEMIRDEFAAFPEGDAPLLLDAAGFPPGPPRFVELRQCRLWVAPPVVDDATLTHTQRVAVGEALSAELQRVLASLGTEIQPCTFVDDPARADLLIWGYGEPEPVTPFNADLDASFLGAPNSRPTPPPEASGGQGGGPALLPAAGSGGLADGDSYKGREAAAWLTALGATALMAIVAVAVTRRIS